MAYENTNGATNLILKFPLDTEFQTPHPHTIVAVCKYQKLKFKNRFGDAKHIHLRYWLIPNMTLLLAQGAEGEEAKDFRSSFSNCA